MRNSVMITLVAAVLFFGIGCGKPKIEGKPELKFEDVNAHEVPRRGLLQFTFKFKSAEVGDSIRMIFSRETGPPFCEMTDFNIPLKFPEYPNTLGEGTLDLKFTNGAVEGYTEIPAPQCGDSDEIVFKFVMIDVKGNVSDTAVTPPIVLLK